MNVLDLGGTKASNTWGLLVARWFRKRTVAKKGLLRTAGDREDAAQTTNKIAKITSRLVGGRLKLCNYHFLLLLNHNQTGLRAR